MATQTVKYLGGLHPLQVVSRDEDGEVREPDVYRGWDNETNQSVVFEADGEAVQVSAEMAERLASEFPGSFEIDGKAAGSKKKTSSKKKAAEPNADEIRAQLLERDRDELNTVAAELGIENPADVESVEELVDAIIAKHSEQ